MFIIGFLLSGCSSIKKYDGIVKNKVGFNSVDDIKNNIIVEPMSKSKVAQEDKTIDPFCDDLDCFVNNFKICKNSQINLSFDNDQYMLHMALNENGVCDFSVVSIKNNKKSLQCSLYKEELKEDLFYYIVYGYKTKNTTIDSNNLKIITNACDKNSTIFVK